MQGGFGFVSFDFDLTVTKQHTWIACGIHTPLSEGDSRLGLIRFQDGSLLIRLINALCSKGVAVCINSRQYGSTIFFSLKTLRGGHKLIADFHGSRFFIFGRESLQVSKAQALTDAFGADVGGLHFDDDSGESGGFAGNHHFCQMEEGTGFSLESSSSLMRGLSEIPLHFSELLTIDVAPSHASLRPPPVKYPSLGSGAARWKTNPVASLSAFVNELRTSLMLSEEDPAAKRRDIVF
ncbi:MULTISPECIES: hypothetical protein [unclassified Chelatococcus]|uniref:hypothetical protein n=1 Tax=unclassified Chelatococcus TaxID=2638111 RepID=UPI001BCB38B5|nr:MULTISPECIES: hypothetical protein [unclassified Chelatococcus]CAH1663821.1 conserved hypothetical protein [Hyphomicrobiales bacterium]MBS7741625.1 hypothetical protein [Chelatococcus sp. HY11]MBX3544356.1 hypothetical protein [Chelatococcus sp.]MCO5079120.1 hypothetical protein [Chelatococcus sp.]CAH1682071.1 conserved hypothetical protein [Hyphomicrobiales bacterium]